MGDFIVSLLAGFASFGECVTVFCAAVRRTPSEDEVSLSLEEPSSLTLGSSLSEALGLTLRRFELLGFVAISSSSLLDDRSLCICGRKRLVSICGKRLSGGETSLLLEGSEESSILLVATSLGDEGSTLLSTDAGDTSAAFVVFAAASEGLPSLSVLPKLLLLLLPLLLLLLEESSFFFLLAAGLGGGGSLSFLLSSLS